MFFSVQQYSSSQILWHQKGAFKFHGYVLYMRIGCTFFHDTPTYESGALMLHACIHRLRIRATLRICMEPHNLAGEGEYCKLKYLTPCFSNQGLPKNVFVQILAWIHVAAVFFVKSFPGIPRDCQGKLEKIWSSMLPSFP